MASVVIPRQEEKLGNVWRCVGISVIGGARRLTLRWRSCSQDALVSPMPGQVLGVAANRDLVTKVPTHGVCLGFLRSSTGLWGGAPSVGGGARPVDLICGNYEREINAQRR